ALIEEIKEFLGDTPNGSVITELLNDTATEAASLSHWFGALLTRLLGSFGLIISDPMLPELRQLMSPFFEQAVDLQQELTVALETTGRELEGRGFTPAFKVDKSFTGLFCIINNQRVALTYQNEKYYAHGLTKTWNRRELGEAMAATPQMFSTSAVLRPVVQDVLFPTLAYIGGPGEIAYFAQLKRVYQLFGLRMPVVFPRKSYVLIEPRVAEILDRFSLKIRDFADTHPEELVSDLSTRLEGKDLHPGFRKLREVLVREHASLIADLAEGLPDLELLAPGNLERMLLQIDYLERKTNQKLRKKHREAVNEFYFALSTLFPKGRPQERMFNVMPFMAGHGREWLDWLVAAGQGDGFSYSYLNQALYIE
ncbi:MAG TPA: bacillithiol biosynthesis cysteine-adding enzyme BshC, partial [Bacillota bacterium]|nr:bacillithiol biosynthesis cysteine-adding enzyme BshC [Bacillota bacterium]